MGLNEAEYIIDGPENPIGVQCYVEAYTQWRKLTRIRSTLTGCRTNNVISDALVSGAIMKPDPIPQHQKLVKRIFSG